MLTELPFERRFPALSVSRLNTHGLSAVGTLNATLSLGQHLFRSFISPNLFFLQNFILIYNYYKMSIPPRTFGKKIFKLERGQFGQQVQKSFKYGFVRDGTLKYLKKPRLDQAQKSVDKYLTQNVNKQQDYRLFKSILRQKIVDSKQRVQQYNLNQIADFLPWVFSSQFLFEPFRSLMYCVKQGIDPGNTVLVYSTLPSQLINNVVEKAIFESVKYQSPFIQIVKDSFRTQQVGYITRIFAVSAKFFAKNINYLISVASAAISATLTFASNVAQYITSWATKIANALIGARWGAGDFDVMSELKKSGIDLEQNNYQLQWGKTILDTITQIFSDLRAYGQIVINFGYLKVCAQKKQINGRVFYYFWDNPNILITCVSSMPAVYTNYNGELVLVPQDSFTIAFLRRLVTNDIIKTGGRLFKQLKKETTLTIQQKEPFNTFKQTYLDFKSKKQLTQEEQQKQDKVDLQTQQYNALLDTLATKMNQRYLKGSDLQGTSADELAKLKRKP